MKTLNTDDFYEDDEPVEDVVWAFENGQRSCTCKYVRPLKSAADADYWISINARHSTEDPHA